MSVEAGDGLVGGGCRGRKGIVGHHEVGFGKIVNLNQAHGLLVEQRVVWGRMIQLWQSQSHVILVHITINKLGRRH